MAYQKIGLNTYCLRALKWRDKQHLDYAASLKLDGIFLQDSLDPEINDLNHWKQVGVWGRELGLPIQTGMGSVLPKRADDLEPSRKQLLLGVQRAKACGSNIIRCLHASDRAHLPPGSIEQHRETMVKLLRSVRSEVMDAGLMLAIENHKDFSARELAETMQAAGKEFVGSYLDTGNPTFILEDPMTTVEVLAPYAVCLHLRDSVMYEHPKGAMVQWVPLGEGVVDFAAIVKHIHAVKPDIFVYIKPITGRVPELFPYREPKFWENYRDIRADDFARFVKLAENGRPYEKPLVIEDLPNRPIAPQFLQAVQAQQKEHMERSIGYAKKTLDLGVRWRTA